MAFNDKGFQDELDLIDSKARRDKEEALRKLRTTELGRKGYDDRIKEIDSGTEDSLLKLIPRIDKAYSAHLQDIDSKLDVTEKSPYERARAHLDNALTRALLPATVDYGDKKPVWDDTSLIALNLQHRESVHRERMAFEKARALSMREPMWLRERINKEANERNIGALKELQSAVELMPSGKDSDELSQLITDILDSDDFRAVRVANMDENQKKLLQERNSLVTKKGLLDGNIKAVREGKKVIRSQGEQEDTVTILRPYSAPTQSGVSSQGE